MKSPLSAGKPINIARYQKWLTEFTSYRHQITEKRIQLWLEQFKKNDQDLAARLLDCIDFINHEQIIKAFRELLAGIEGWSQDKRKRKGKWRFVAYTSSAGESGDEMLHKFRFANNLSSREYNDLFIYKSDLMKDKLTAEDTVIFIDDFSGSGDQVCDYWTEIQELLPGEPRIFLILVAASHLAIDQISKKTDIICISHKMIKEKDRLFSDNCNHFNNNEKEKILKYCKIADKKNPKGYKECGFVIVFSHTCPNDTIPILHKNTDKWQGLFRRFD
jgi:hypothetical protein